MRSSDTARFASPASGQCRLDRCPQLARRRRDWVRRRGRGENGAPLPRVAQIDLAEVAAEAGKTAMPDKGSLAFSSAAKARLSLSEGETGAPPAARRYVGFGRIWWLGGLADRPCRASTYPFWPLISPR